MHVGRIAGKVHIADLQVLAHSMSDMETRLPNRRPRRLGFHELLDRIRPIADDPPHWPSVCGGRLVIDNSDEKDKSALNKERVRAIAFQSGGQRQIGQIPGRIEAGPWETDIQRMTRSTMGAVGSQQPGTFAGFVRAARLVLKLGRHAASRIAATDQADFAFHAAAKLFQRVAQQSFGNGLRQGEHERVLARKLVEGNVDDGFSLVHPRAAHLQADREHLFGDARWLKELQRPRIDGQRLRLPRWHRRDIDDASRDSRPRKKQCGPLPRWSGADNQRPMLRWHGYLCAGHTLANRTRDFVTTTNRPVS